MVVRARVSLHLTAHNKRALAIITKYRWILVVDLEAAASEQLRA